MVGWKSNTHISYRTRRALSEYFLIFKIGWAVLEIFKVKVAILTHCWPFNDHLLTPDAKVAAKIFGSVTYSTRAFFKKKFVSISIFDLNMFPCKFKVTQFQTIFSIFTKIKKVFFFMSSFIMLYRSFATFAMRWACHHFSFFTFLPQHLWTFRFSNEIFLHNTPKFAFVQH